jgi:hypothetical protein
VAAGEVKAPAIVGAARAGLVDVLVTEATTAEAVLTALDARSRETAQADPGAGRSLSPA